MIKVIDGLSDNIVGVTLSGNVSGEDYERVLMPMIKEKVTKHKKVRVLYHVDDGFNSYDFKAMIDDAHIGFEYWSSYEKIALVSDIGWITNGVKAFSFLMPGEIKLFSQSELEKAKKWIEKPLLKHLSLDVNIDPKNAIVTLHPKDKLSKDDFIRAGSLIDPFIEKVGKLNGLIIETKEFPGWDSFSALFTHLKFVKEHHTKVKKLAFVTDSIIGEGAENIGNHFISAEIKRFNFADLEEAKAWILEE
jgi:hypothetical protein